MRASSRLGFPIDIIYLILQILHALWKYDDFIPDKAQSCSDYNGNPSFTQIIVASSVGMIFAVAMHYRLKQMRGRKIIPRLRLSRSGHAPKL